MKKILLVFFIITCYSCNTDDSPSIVNDVSQQHLVSKIISTSFVLGEPEIINSKTYVNNRPIVDSIYSISNDTWIYINFFYENDRLVLRKVSSSASNQIEEFLIDYDGLGRISQTTEITNTYTSTTSFTYEDQFITSENNDNGEITTKIFQLNNDGIIYKEVNSNETIEIQYDEDYNVMSLNSSAIPLSTYTYDQNLLPPNNFQFFRNFMFGDYKNNYVLYENNIGSAVFSDIAIVPKYHLSVANSLFSHTFEWTYTNGYPTSRVTIDENNHLVFKIDYFYN
ncbi:hypothetical protein [Psychroserpens mesophilus]|uniref:hypothetical protein n=1 Tax=Psychroserpens mesophilus TaxID=325473 RepID=UPI000590E0FB|nr:hypothetical protein [Psychroserpens mesophilus]